VATPGIARVGAGRVVLSDTAVYAGTPETAMPGTIRDIDHHEYDFNLQDLEEE
jgi:hypothetical protein